MKQSAVEWYFKQMQSKEKFTQDEFDSIYQQAKEMEKQQIDDAWDKGYKQGKYDPYFDNEDEDDDNI
jgi:hypothetical protein